ncbi:hypothetical protein GOEFS_039_00210 [Gordonia effusa NBRC 100432]|uniref:Uncharacterized protein n=1 Tax=Gordonia effusa NBRC 100432 TaxID=1077974 RepID=H0QY86_9ACTN|nr:hypothetical protein [Gordonia effusa]GAB17787.1 hypothetical protein GOEFS_039_00210 [Gordonia effusa NBRC 100432]
MTTGGDPRTVLQAHKLRTQLASSALIHGSQSLRGKQLTLRLIVISLVLAAVILVGIVAAGFIIDYFASRR